MLILKSEIFLNLTKLNLKHNCLPHLAASSLFLIIAPFIFSIKNLDAIHSAFILERFISLIGIVLFTPVFLPEQGKEISETIFTKYISSTTIYFIRIIIAMVFYSIFIFLFIYIMINKNCSIDLIKYSFGTFSSGLFIGSIGILSYALFNNVTIAYMIPFLYYMINMFTKDKYVKMFYLFSMELKSFYEKYWLFAFGLILICVGIFIKYIKNIHFV